MDPGGTGHDDILRGAVPFGFLLENIFKKGARGYLSLALLARAGYGSGVASDEADATPPAVDLTPEDTSAPVGPARPSARVRVRAPEVPRRVAAAVLGVLVAVTAVNVYCIGRGTFSRLPKIEANDANGDAAAGLVVAPPFASSFSSNPADDAASSGALSAPDGDAAGLEARAGDPLDSDGGRKIDGAAPPDGEPRKGSKRSGKRPDTVAAALSAGCSTSSVNDLSRQIIAEARCMDADAFALVPSRKNLIRGSQAFLFLEAPARDRLIKILDAHPQKTLTVNSSLRTIAQQYLLYRWSVTKRCGIEVAALPGESNHEGGLALDIREPGTWRPLLEKEGFKWFGPSDKVHFDYAGAGAVDHTGLDVLAFQKLWNMNHADDRIAESSRFDKETEARLAKSPAAGFAIAPHCGGRDATKKPPASAKRP
jgi:hypothetical protein